MANLAERIWRTGSGPAQVVSTTSLHTFFATSDRLTDPRVAFDGASGRWFASISDLDATSVLLEVSKTADPTAGWNAYSFPVGGCADQPRLGIDDVTVVLSADIFADCGDNGSPSVGGKMWIVNKQQLLDGVNPPASTSYGPVSTVSSYAPVQSLSSTTTEYVVSVNAHHSGVVHLYAVTGVPPAPVTVNEVGAPAIDPLSDPPGGLQPKASGAFRQPVIATNDDRVLDSVWQDGRLWFSADTACTPAGDTAVRACARVVELATATASVAWSLNVARSGASTFFPNMRPDAAGNLVIVYGQSSPLEMPGVLAVARAPDGTVSAPAVIGQSVAQQFGVRYGDYFGAALDPATGTVWVGGEVPPGTSFGQGWKTVVASLAVSATGGTPPPVATPPPPRLRAQAIVGRAGHLVRLGFQSLGEGSGVHAVVTVGRKGGVVFRKTTPGKTVHTGSLYSVAWRPAVRLHGAFSFCVFSELPDGSESARNCARLTLR